MIWISYKQLSKRNTVYKNLQKIRDFVLISIQRPDFNNLIEKIRKVYLQLTELILFSVYQNHVL